MQTWLELEKEFKSISEQMKGMRLDIQWGAAGEYLRIAGFGYNRNLEKRYFALASIAGQKLNEFLPKISKVHEEVINEKNSSSRWVKGIWKISGNFEYGTYGEQLTEKGESGGFIYTGTINEIAEASAIFCLELSALFPQDSKNDQTENTDWKQKISEATNLKPGLFGFSVDLKKLFPQKRNK